MKKRTQCDNQNQNINFDAIMNKLVYAKISLCQDVSFCNKFLIFQ